VGWGGGAYQGDGETENASFAVHKQNAVFIPRVQVEVVVHAESAHVFQGVLGVLQLHFLHRCRRDGEEEEEEEEEGGADILEKKTRQHTLPKLLLHMKENTEELYIVITFISVCDYSVQSVTQH